MLTGVACAMQAQKIEGAMPDIETVESDPTETTPEETDTTAVSEPTETAPELGGAGKQAIQSEREARKAAERELREAQKALQEYEEKSKKEYEDRDKTELQKALERAEAAEKLAEKAQFDAIRSKVASAKGVPEISLTGSTEEELTLSAEKLLEWRDSHKASQEQVAPPPPRNRAPSSPMGLRSGASGKENSNPDPKAAAADALRRLRTSG